MATLPDEVSKAWENRKGPVIFSTTDQTGTPNAIYATCVSKFNEETLVIADNYFSKTKANILKNSKGSILFITEDDKSYQIKGAIEYHTHGEAFDDMKKWNPSKHPGHAAAVLKAEEIYSGAKKLS